MIFESASVHPYGSFYLDVADKAVKGVAVIVAGTWTYINAIRSGIFKRKLEPKVSAKLFEVESAYYISVECHLKNVGQARYPIRQKGTALKVTPLTAGGRGEVIISPVFQKHGWIEAGEEIVQPLIVPVEDANKTVAFEINLRVVSESDMAEDALEWNASCVASLYLTGGKDTLSQG